MLEQIEVLHNITITTTRISAMVEDSVHPICSVCGGTITEADRTAVCVTILVSSKMEWFHDTVNCFERYMYTLAHYFNNRHSIDTYTETIQ